MVLCQVPFSTYKMESTRYSDLIPGVITHKKLLQITELTKSRKWPPEVRSLSHPSLV
jgi:hypothetical protein